MLNTWSPKTTLIMAGLAIAGVWYLKSQAGEAIEQAAEAVDKNLNPTKSSNLANRGAMWVWDQFTDGEGTIGTDIYDAQQALSEWWRQ